MKAERMLTDSVNISESIHESQIPRFKTETEAGLAKNISKSQANFRIRTNIPHAIEEIIKRSAMGKLRLSSKDNKLTSTYKDNFSKKEGQRSESLKQKEPFYQQKGQNMSTVYNEDYHNPDLSRFNVCRGSIFVPRHTPDPQLENVKPPFQKSSSYAENFLNFGTSLPNFSFRPSKISTIDNRLPFYIYYGNREYGNFNPSDLPIKDDPKKYAISQYKNPIASDVALKGESNMKESYQAYPGHQHSRSYQPKEEWQNYKLPAFKNQFQTSSSHFKGLQSKNCASRLILRRA